MQFRIDRVKLFTRALRRVILRSSIYRSPIVNTMPLASFCSHRDLIGIEVLCSGSFECEFLELSKSLVNDHVAGQGGISCSKIAVDVGANIGTHALFFSTITDRVLAFEPNLPVSLVCQANALAAGTDKIEVFNIALSDRSGTASLFAPRGGNFGWASLEISNPDRTPVSVRVERGDDFILPRIAANERIVLVKIDVEGHEPNVFRGISGVLRQHKPVIIFESLSSSHLLSCRQVLEPLGYLRFDAVHKDWEDKGYAGKLLSLFSRKTSIRLIPVDFTADRFYSAVVGYPSESGSPASRCLHAGAGPPLADNSEHKDWAANNISTPQPVRLAQQAK